MKRILVLLAFVLFTGGCGDATPYEGDDVYVDGAVEEIVLRESPPTPAASMDRTDMGWYSDPITFYAEKESWGKVELEASAVSIYDGDNHLFDIALEHNLRVINHNKEDK